MIALIKECDTQSEWYETQFDTLRDIAASSLSADDKLVTMQSILGRKRPSTTQLGIERWYFRRFANQNARRRVKAQIKRDEAKGISREDLRESIHYVEPTPGVNYGGRPAHIARIESDVRNAQLTRQSREEFDETPQDFSHLAEEVRTIARDPWADDVSANSPMPIPQPQKPTLPEANEIVRLANELADHTAKANSMLADEFAGLETGRKLRGQSSGD